jgi:hypothetical protein
MCNFKMRKLEQLKRDSEVMSHMSFLPMCSLSNHGEANNSAIRGSMLT